MTPEHWNDDDEATAAESGCLSLRRSVRNVCALRVTALDTQIGQSGVGGAAGWNDDDDDDCNIKQPARGSGI